MPTREEVWKQFVADFDVEVSEQSIQNELEYLKIALRHAMTYDTLTGGASHPFPYLELEAQTDELRAAAEFEAKAPLVVKAVIAEQNLEVTHVELEAEAQALAQRQETTVETLKQFFGDDLSMLRHDVLERKAIDWACESLGYLLEDLYTEEALPARQGGSSKLEDYGKDDQQGNTERAKAQCVANQEAAGHMEDEGKERNGQMTQSKDTICVQGGWHPGNAEPRQVPIYQNTTWRYATGEGMARLFDLEESGYFYTRLANPTNDAVAAKICELEGGSAAMLTSSGQAANFFALFNICEAGSHIVASSAIYGGTYNLIAVTMAKMGIESTFVAPDCTPEELHAAFKPNTRALFGETIANPALNVFDFDKFAAAANTHGVPLIVDNTFATPLNCRPFEHGAHIVTHSTTKYMDGHGSAVGGAIVDSGTFDWLAYADKYPGLTTPDSSYHGVTYAKDFGLEGAFITKATAQLMRDFGAIPSPQNAFLLNLGLESLHVRMKQHCANGQAVAEYLHDHPKVSWVRFSGLPTDADYALAQKYLPHGGCGVVSFGVAGGRDAAQAFMANLKLASIATHVADARTCCLHPASTTHRQMSDEELLAAGVAPDLVRLSCGIEATQDIIADLEQAFAAL